MNNTFSITGIRILRIAGLFAALAVAGGCVTTTVISTNSVSANTSTEEVPEEQLLDVGITVFGTGLEPPGGSAQADGSAQGEEGAEGEESAQGEAGKQQDPGRFVSAQVRSAESRYIPFRLRDTLQQTGYWGAVRVIPAASNSVDLTVNGRILHSDGERLALRVEAIDATGRVWLDRKYEHVAAQLSYRESLSYRDDEPFQDLYDSIANDLAAALGEVSAKQRVAIRQVAELRFAGDLAPEPFDDYLAKTGDGRYEIRRLPAYSDPMVARMRRIREREYLFFDTLDDYYETFADEMEVPYSEWRKYTYDEVVALRQLKRQSLAHTLIGGAMIVGGLASNSSSTIGNIAEWGAVTGGIAAITVGFDQRRQSKLHAATLEELNSSFETEVEPMVMEIEGQTVTLQGSLERQFKEWRGILRDIYALETGQIASTSPAPAGSSSDAGSAEPSTP